MCCTYTVVHARIAKEGTPMCIVKVLYKSQPQLACLFAMYVMPARGTRTVEVYVHRQAQRHKLVATHQPFCWTTLRSDFSQAKYKRFCLVSKAVLV